MSVLHKAIHLNGRPKLDQPLPTRPESCLTSYREAVFVVFVGVGRDDPHIPSVGRGAPTGTYIPGHDEEW